MVESVIDATARMDYIDRKALIRSGLPEKEFCEGRQAALNATRTLYVGNLSHYTTEDQLWGTFLPFGDVEDVIMVLHREARTPAGACFVIFREREAAALAVATLDGAVIDEREVTVKWDDGADVATVRRWGRGFGGGMVVDSLRQTFDEGRGGLGDRQAAATGIGHTVATGDLVPHVWVELLK